MEGLFEADGGRWEGSFAQQGEGFAGAELALHAAIFPFDGEWAIVTDVVEGAQDGVEIHFAAAGGDEIPATARITEGQVAGEAGIAAVEVARAVFDVDVEDAFREGMDQLNGVDALGDEVAGVEVDAKGGVAIDGGEGGGEGVDVVGDFGGVDFEGEADAELLEDIEDGAPAGGEIFVASVDHGSGRRREGVELGPDAAASETVDDGDAELGGGLGGADHLRSGALTDAFGLAIAPDFGADEGAVAFVDRVTDALADEVVGDGPAAQAVGLEQVVVIAAVLGAGEGLADGEVIAPAGELQAIVAPIGDALSEGG